MGVAAINVACEVEVGVEGDVDVEIELFNFNAPEIVVEMASEACAAGERCRVGDHADIGI